MNFIAKILRISLVILIVVSCTDDDDNIIKPPVTLDIVESATIDPNLSIFLAALKKTELTAMLKEEGPFTVLAPNDAAFEALYVDLGVLNLEEIPVPTLKNILLNHIISDSKLSTSNLTSGQGTGYKTTLATGTAAPDTNLNLFFDTTNGVIFNGSSAIISGKENTEATNGFLHQVESVIQLPTVLQFATADANFDSLEMALLRQDQDSIAQIFSDETKLPVTLFAPDNDSFADLLEELNSKQSDTLAPITLENMDAELLKNTLNLHIATDTNIRVEQITDGTITTIGGTITSTASPATLKDTNNNTATLTVTNLQAADGVIHALDKVLLPSN